MDPVLIPWSGKTRENGLKSSTTARAGSRVISPRTNYSSGEGEGGRDGCEKSEGAMNLEGERHVRSIPNNKEGTVHKTCTHGFWEDLFPAVHCHRT